MVESVVERAGSARTSAIGAPNALPIDLRPLPFVLMDKADILDAIRSCARENGGRAVGRRRFEVLTGITEADWLGRYWARWGDALQDAGFEPNVLQGKTPDDQLLDQLVTVIRELGRFPTDPELRLRRRQEPSFPSHGVFHRLGRRQEIAKRLIEHCRDDPELIDVLAICQPLAMSSPTDSQGKSGDPERSETVGTVYLVKSGAYYKIGRSNSAGRRAYELSIQLPERLELVHVIATDDPSGIENYWHRRFAARRANGEWFDLTKEDVAAFRRRKTFM